MTQITDAAENIIKGMLAAVVEGYNIIVYELCSMKGYDILNISVCEKRHPCFISFVTSESGLLVGVHQYI